MVDGNIILSVAKAMELLQILSQAGKPLLLKELTALCGYPKSTVFGLLTTMRAYDVVTQTPDGRAHGGEFLSIFNLESIRKNAGAIAAELEIPVEAARTWMEDCIICAHGIVTLLIAGLMTAARGEAKEKLFRMGCGALIAAGADKARTRAILEPLRGGNV